MNLDASYLEKIKQILGYKLLETQNVQISISTLLIIFLIIAITLFVLRILKRVFKGFTTRGVLDIGTSNSMYLIIKYFIWVFVVAALLDTVGIKVSILIASAAALLVGVGLGLQQFFNDVASGIILLVERSLKVSDIVELENEMVGKVMSIGIRTSKIKTRDNIVMIVPNSKLVNDRVINWSHAETHTRFHVNVGVAYGSDVELVSKVLLACAEAHPKVLSEPKSFVRFVDFADSSLNFQLFFWTDESFIVENTKSDLRFRINAAFAANDIKIPFPQMDLHVKSAFYRP
jgi:small-conductance mechanosensitive channel